MLIGSIGIQNERNLANHHNSPNGFFIRFQEREKRQSFSS